MSNIFDGHTTDIDGVLSLILAEQPYTYIAVADIINAFGDSVFEKDGGAAILAHPNCTPVWKTYIEKLITEGLFG